MSERIHPKNTEEAREKFRQQLEIIRESFDPVYYSIVGGAALRAILGGELLPFRPNGTQADIDGIALGPHPTGIKAAYTQLEAAKNGDDSFPEIGIESAHFANEPVPHKLFATLSGMRVADDGTVYMSYRGLQKKVPKSTIETVPMKINGVEFPVFPAKTILKRYWLRGGGVLKPKDVGKVRDLEKYVRDNPKGQPDDSEYAAYDDFMREIQEKYGVWLRLYQLFWKADQLSGGRMSGAKGWWYSMIPHFNS